MMESELEKSIRKERIVYNYIFSKRSDLSYLIFGLLVLLDNYGQKIKNACYHCLSLDHEHQDKYLK